MNRGEAVFTRDLRISPYNETGYSQALIKFNYLPTLLATLYSKDYQVEYKLGVF